MVPAQDTAEWDAAKEYWLGLQSDEGAYYDKVVMIEAADIAPTVTWGTSPQDVAPITGTVPDPQAESDPARQAGMVRALQYMGLENKVGTQLASLAVDQVFIGSCTNGA